MFSITQADDRTVIIEPGAEIERDQMRHLRLLLESLLRSGARQVVLDLTRTEHLYYRVTDLLALIDERLRLQGGSLVLVGMNRYIEDIFCITGYVDHFKRSDSALAGF
jgi:anti-anti-sigma factor